MPDYRFWVQIAFTMLVIWIGVEFHYFIEYLKTAGASGSSYRPPGVEGFLPISSLMSLYYFVLSGDIHSVHPAGMFILVGVLTVSFIFGKSFCSWLCPVGLLSEILGDLGDKIFGRRLRLPRWLDYPLRSIKYLVLGFFVYSIFFLMTQEALRAFLDTPYNIVADVKMYYFFANISRFSLIVIGVLFLFSIIIRNFWCRYLCPYGALLGIVTLLSPQKIKRNVASCTDCGLCAEACPSSIKVDKVKMVVSDECTACMSCVNVCPVVETLELKSTIINRVLPKKLVAFGVVAIFVLAAGVGMATGYWQSSTTIIEYQEHHKNIHSMGHPTSSNDISKFNKTTSKRRGSQGK
ncbi:MAG: 4Fe-4S binding protein [candidate division Zixibacteria bacterium]|nr:4Fe-4S binding protein [candidate division Zixibacteria bacterium]